MSLLRSVIPFSSIFYPFVHSLKSINKICLKLSKSFCAKKGKCMQIFISHFFSSVLFICRFLSRDLSLWFAVCVSVFFLYKKGDLRNRKQILSAKKKEKDPISQSHNLSTLRLPFRFAGK